MAPRSARPSWLLCMLPFVAATLDQLTGDGSFIVSSNSTACELLPHPRKDPRPGGQGTAGQDPVTRGWCSNLVQSRRYHNPRCKGMPWMAPSHGCSAIEPSHPAAWMPATERTVWFWGDSVMEQLWDHMLCFLGGIAPPEQSHAGGLRRQLLKSKKKKKKGKSGPHVAWGKRGSKGRLVVRPLEFSPELARRECKPYRNCVRCDASRIDEWVMGLLHVAGAASTGTCLIISGTRPCHSPPTRVFAASGSGPCEFASVAVSKMQLGIRQTLPRAFCVAGPRTCTS